MSDQLSLFESIAAEVLDDVMPVRSKPPSASTLPEVCVLRDWMLEEELFPEVPLEPCHLIDIAPERAAPLADIALEAVLAYLLAPMRVYLPRGGSRSRRRLSRLEVEEGIALHVEALRLARRWRLATHRVQTRLVGGGEGLVCDRVLLVGSAVTADRVRDENGLCPESRIPLLPGWQAQRRKGLTFPWDPPPSGWVIDHRACRLVKATREGWVTAAEARAANPPVVLDVHRIVFEEAP